MNRKEILAKSRTDMKENFGVLLGAVLIVYLAVLVFELLPLVGLFWRFMITLSSGLFTSEQILSRDSDFWSVLQLENSLGGGGIIGIIITYFLVNPLSVGVNRVFIDAADKKASIKSIMVPFKTNYINIVKNMFLSNIFYQLIIFGLGIAMFVILWLLSVPVLLLAKYTLFTGIFYVLLSLALYAGFMALAIKFSYNFSMIPYLIVDSNEKFNFSHVYNISKNMAAGRKLGIFKIDISISIWAVISVFIPAALIGAGVFMALNHMDGAMLAGIGALLVIPMIFINLYLSVYRGAAWANIYKKIKNEEEMDKHPNNDRVMHG